MSFVPKRIVSLQPSVTVTIDRLGLLDHVVACTKYCVDVCPALREQGKTIVADSWTAQAAQILAAKPDMVIASVPYQLEAVAEILKAGVPFLGFAPHSLHDVYCDISHIAAILEVPERGRRLIEEMQSEVHHVGLRAQRATEGGGRPQVYCEEWGKPLILSQAWVAELIEVCGGVFLGMPGHHTNEESVREQDPDVIIAAWCGAGDRVPLEKIIPARGWSETKAARNNRVFCINDEYLNTPGPTLISGLYALAAAIHPEAFPTSTGLRRMDAAVTLSK
ncbi:MAG: Fe3+-hydroxamate transporter, periplasmic ligand binding protein [Candidatus Angelobacter sp.]|jgi:iron complex transport system substrate-binding protein|nr:Fe3+-hydroxamate transporter, periplasmic ligand binding protein [Candidatus Angelobacter sp.]